MYTKELLKLGFSKGEAEVYLAALELGETTATRIAKKADIERTTIYSFLDSLKKRGFIFVTKKGRKTVFIAENPKKLRSELEERGKFIDSILPGLLSITNVLDKKPSIQYFDSKEGIYDIYRETLEYPRETINLWMSSPWFDNESFWRNIYLPTRLEKKISMRAILPKTNENIDFAKDDSKSLRETKMTDGKDITTDIMLYGGRRIAIISYEESTGLVIESKRLFETLMTIFNSHWNSLPSSRKE